MHNDHLPTKAWPSGKSKSQYKPIRKPIIFHLGRDRKGPVSSAWTSLHLEVIHLRSCYTRQDLLTRYGPLLRERHKSSSAPSKLPDHRVEKVTVLQTPKSVYHGPPGKQVRATDLHLTRRSLSHVECSLPSNLSQLKSSKCPSRSTPKPPWPKVVDQKHQPDVVQHVSNISKKSI